MCINSLEIRFGIANGQILLTLDEVTCLPHDSGGVYSKCPKISNTKISDKMPYANSADPDQTAPERTVLSASSLFTIPLSIFKRRMHKKKRNLSKKVWNKMLEILGHLP